MLKGHTKIELTNVKTGEKKVVEKHNLVTNGVASLYGRLTNDYLLSGDVDLYFGGLLLFEKPIDENVNNYRLPLGNRMIGNGAVGYSPLTPPEFGSYNTDESSLTIENGTVTRKYVYDFSTSKGNGTISAVCLANKYCGFHGAGNANDYAESPSTYLTEVNKNLSYLNYSITNKTNYTNFSPNIIELDYEKNVIVTWGLEETGVRLFYVYYPFSKLNPLLKPGTIYKTVLVPYPEKITSALGTSFYAEIFSTPDGSYMLCMKKYYCSLNEKFFVWKLLDDLSGNNVYELVNATNWGFACDNNNGQRNALFTIVADYFLFKSSVGKVLNKIRLSNPTDVKQIQIVDNIGTAYKTDTYLFNYNGKVLLTTNNYGNNVPCTFMYDYINDTICRINPQLQFNPNNSVTPMKYFHIKGISDRIAACYYGKLNETPAIYRNWLVLSTINNLSEPVEKTSDMTMKVTYTITGKIEEGDE